MRKEIPVGRAADIAAEDIVPAEKCKLQKSLHVETIIAYPRHID